MLITGPAPYNTDHGPEFYLLQQQQIEIVAERKKIIRSKSISYLSVESLGLKYDKGPSTSAILRTSSTIFFRQTSHLVNKISMIITF